MKDEITELRELCADIRKFIQEERLSEAKEKLHWEWHSIQMQGYLII